MADPLGAVATIIGLIGTVRDLVNTEKETWGRFKELPKVFENVLRELDACDDQLNDFNSSYKSAEDELSEELKRSYVKLITSQKDRLVEIKADIEGLKAKIPKPGISSGLRQWLKSQAKDRKIVARASDSKEMISEFVGDLKKLSEKCHDEMKSLHGKRGDQYTPHFYTPRLENIILKMDDDKTAEGQLKQEVMTGMEATAVLESSPHLTESSTSSGGATSAEGLGGIGKTTALQGLANDEDVKKKFKDGVFFMTFGKEADEKKLKENYCMIVRQSGGKKLCKSIESSTLQEVTDETAKWFKDKKTLFICDDLWPTALKNTGYLNEIMRLTQSLSTCHLVLSTRYGEIASKACSKSGTVVKFKTLDVNDRRGQDVLLKYADVSDTDFQSLSDNEKNAVGGILKQCGGLYFALAVAGGILLDSKKERSLAAAVQKLCFRLNSQEEDLLDGNVEEHNTTLYRCFEESLERIHGWAEKQGLGDFWSNTIPRLCVYQKTAKLTTEMIKCVWLVELHVGKLVERLRNFHLLESEKDADLYTFHDLFHDFCIRKAGGERVLPKLHREFLDNAAKRCGVVNLGQPSTEQVCGRSWWDLPDGGEVEAYMRSNLAWHLKEARKVDELEALMTQFEWTLLRFKKNDYNEMMSDLSIWVNEEEKKWREGAVDRNQYIKKRQMRQAISSAWSKSDSEKELATHVLGHLLGSREVSKFAKSYIDSVESIGLKAWLRPSQQIWEAPIEDVIGVQCSVRDISVNWKTDEAIAVGGEGQIALLNLSTLTVNVPNEDINRKVTCVARSRNGKTVILGSQEGEIVLWDEISRQTVRTICNIGGHVSSVVVSDDGSRAAFSCDKTVYVLDVEKREVLCVHEDHFSSVRQVTMSGDGGRIASGSYDKTVRVWDVEKGKKMCVLDGHEHWVSSVAMNRSGKRVVSGSWDGTVRVWDVEMRKELCKFEGQGNGVCVAMNEDGSRVVSGLVNFAVRVWDKDKKELCVFEGHQRPVASIAMNGDGSRVVSGSCDKTVRVWDVEKGKKLCVNEGHERWEDICAISGEGSRILSCLHQKTVRVWDVVKKEILCELEARVNEGRSVSMCRDGSRVAFCSLDKSVWVWDVERRQKLCKLEGHTGDISSITISGDGSRVASGSSDETVCVWDVEKKEKLCQIEGHAGVVFIVTMSGDGSCVASCSQDFIICVWDVEKGKKICKLEGHTSLLSSVAMSADGSRIVSSSYDDTVRVWNVEKEEEMCKLEGHKGSVHIVAINADGSSLAFQSTDGLLMVFKVMDEGYGPLHQNYMLFQMLRLPTTSGLIFNGHQIVIGLVYGFSIKYDMVE